jgi:hypothetical protein
MDIFASRVAIAAEAEQAAIHCHWARERGGAVTSNPFPEGSDAHAVWKAHFDSKWTSLESMTGVTC